MPKNPGNPLLLSWPRRRPNECDNYRYNFLPRGAPVAPCCTGKTITGKVSSLPEGIFIKAYLVQAPGK